MKHFIIYLILFVGTTFSLQAQDKLVLRNGRTIEVNVQRSLEDRVEYTYPGETSVYERPKTAISYILYKNGRKEICDQRLRNEEVHSSSADRYSSTRRNKLSEDDDIFWQDVKATFMESEVRDMTRLKRISAVSNVSYKDAILALKKKSAAIGGTTVLVMDIPEDENTREIEVMGIAYRDEDMEYVPRSVSERNSASEESSSNARRRRIAQQRESYNNDYDLEFEDYAQNTSASHRSTSRNNTSRSQVKDEAPDAIHLINGQVIRGSIEEFEPDDFVSIRTTKGKIYEYSMDDVRRVSRGRNKRSSLRNSDRGYDSGSRYYNDGYYGTSGYKGIFDLGYTLPVGVGEKGRFEIHTSHGYQVNEYFFIGAGVGLHMYSARDASLKDGLTYPQYVGSRSGEAIVPDDSVTYMRAVDSAYMTLPLFVDLRGYLPLQNSAVTPFAMFRFGYSFNLSDGFGGMGLYMNPAVGIKYQASPMIGLNFSLGYSYQAYGGIPADGGYGFYYYKSAADKVDEDRKYEAKGAGGFTLKLGIEF